MSLSTYVDRFRQLNVNVAHGRASPHKICMLLAVLDLARGGALTANRVEFAPPLLERYALYFNAVRAEGDHPNPYFPFFHLAGRLRGGGESFWHLQPKSGREHVLASMSTARTARQVTDNIDHARLDADLFDLLQDGVLSRNRRKFRQPINVACPAPGRWGRPNSRVTSRHFDHGNASRTSRPDCSGLDEAD